MSVKALSIPFDASPNSFLNFPLSFRPQTFGDSPLVGFGRPWVSGTTFYGEPLESNMDKITYNAY